MGPFVLSLSLRLEQVMVMVMVPRREACEVYMTMMYKDEYYITCYTLCRDCVNVNVYEHRARFSSSIVSECHQYQ